MARNVLVLTTVASETEPILRQVREAARGEEVNVRVVAPAVKLSPLQWLTNAEDDARGEAEQTADRVAEALPGDAVETEVGDSDPIQAIEDALATFPADEIVIITRPGKDASWLEQGSAERALARFDVPVRRMTLAEDA